MACASSAPKVITASGLAEIAKAGPDAGAKATILVLMPETAQTREVWKGLSDELAEEYRLVAVRIEGASESSVIAEAVKRYNPAALVLMNNPTVTAYREYQSKSSVLKFPPAVVVMTSFLEGQVGQMIGATGVTYEIPLITVMTNLRKLVVLNSERVGVVVREPLKKFISKEVLLAQREKVQVVTEYVSAQPNASELKRAIRRLKNQSDVIWILNDDRLLSPRLISDAWLPGLDERPWKPTIVGAGSLVSAERSFGTFAVLPDHVALGAQAAALLLDMADNQWTIDSGAAIQLPLSTTTTMDLKQVKERFSMQKEALQQVDRVVE
jgi:hypothetical protein